MCKQVCEPESSTNSIYIVLLWNKDVRIQIRGKTMPTEPTANYFCVKRTKPLTITMDNNIIVNMT